MVLRRYGYLVTDGSIVTSSITDQEAMFHFHLSMICARPTLRNFWWDKLHETFHSVTYPATTKIVARQVARAVAESRIKFYFSCNLSRNDFGRCRLCYTVKCFVQLAPAQCCQNIARQVARNVSQCNSALTLP